MYLPKRFEGTEVNRVRKRVSAIDHTFTEKNCTHIVCILAQKKPKFMSTRDLTRTKNKQIIEVDYCTNPKTTLLHQN